MNIKKNIWQLAALAAVTFTSACTSVGEHDSKAELYYTNYTKADTEHYQFLHQVYQLANDEIGMRKLLDARETGAPSRSALGSVSESYQQILERLPALGAEANVLIPAPGFQEFSAAKLDSSAIASLNADFMHKSVHNQEAIVGQFKNASVNTNPGVREFAREWLPTLEENLEKTKSAH